MVEEETVLTDDQLYTRLDGLYQTIVSYGDEDQIGEVIDSFNNGYLRTPLSTRQSCRRVPTPCATRSKRRKMSLTTLSIRTIRSMRTTSPT